MSCPPALKSPATIVLASGGFQTNNPVNGAPVHNGRRGRAGGSTIRCSARNRSRKAASGNDPDGIRTRVAALKGPCPRPLDDRACRGRRISIFRGGMGLRTRSGLGTYLHTGPSARVVVLPESGICSLRTGSGGSRRPALDWRGSPDSGAARARHSPCQSLSPKLEL